LEGVLAPDISVKTLMKRRILYPAGLVLLVFLVTLVVLQGSFSLGIDEPGWAGQEWLLWAVSTLVVFLMITLGFMLFRTGVKLYVERRANREGSRIKTKLVIGALALSITPVMFLVLYSVSLLNININKWFGRPAESLVNNLIDVKEGFEREVERRAEAQARYLAELPEIGGLVGTGVLSPSFPSNLCARDGIAEAYVRKAEGTALPICGNPPAEGEPEQRVTARAPVAGSAGAEVIVRVRMPADLAARQKIIEADLRQFRDLVRYRRELKYSYILMLVLISLFVLFVATWIALLLARQISGPISALVEAAGQLRRGNLSYRIRAPAIDELGTLVRAFNEMSAELEASEAELERRRSFTEAILESIPTGVLSLSADRRILRANPALTQMLGADKVAHAVRLEDLFPLEDAREIHYLINRARRTGIATAQLEIEQERQTLHLSVTVSALVGKHAAGFVIVVEDTSELLRAQKTAAWNEVARRIAHEMKNPLTPIVLSAERIGRQIAKLGASGNTNPLPDEVVRILKECSVTISAEVQSVKTLVDEFSQFARFPAAVPTPSDLNEVVESALAVFQDRLDGIMLVKSLASGLPSVMIDRDQFRRVVVNLVDNAAEAMQNSAERRLAISTQLAAADTVELIISDTGHGIQPDDLERLFLPYFSTKGRGTGLGLAIVHHIVAEHGAQIRVDRNQPAGARFVVEIPVPQVSESDMQRAVEVRV
jgi:nitrogen fixation/metabolism regulation signal transduction histidine kinase